MTRSPFHCISHGPAVSNGLVLIAPLPLNSTIRLPAGYACETLTNSDIRAEDRTCLNRVVITVLAYGLLAPLRRCRQPGAFGWKIAAIGEYSISLTRFLRCLAMAGFYSYTPEKFFQRLVREFGAFCSSPSEEGIMSVVFPLCHLREWLSPGFAKEVGKRAATREACFA